MKKLFEKSTALLLAALLLFGSAAAGADGFAQALDALNIRAHAVSLSDLSYEINGDEVTITGCNYEAEGELEIPAEIEGKPVTAISDNALCYNSITKITIPATVTSIGEFAFPSDLESITVAEDNPAYHLAGNCLIETESKTLVLGFSNSVIPDDGSVTTIGNYAFNYCKKLTTVTIPDSVTTIGNYAFCSCDGLTEITIPDGVTTIGDSAFSDCDGLTEITIPGSVTTIGKFAFNGCSDLADVSLPEGLRKIGENAFNYTKVKDVVIPASVIEVYCSSFEFREFSTITVARGNTAYRSAGNCLIETETGALVAGCNNSVIPADGSVTAIGGSAFSGCSELAEVTIPEGVTYIGMYAFFGCVKLKSVTIPGSVVTVGNYAFEDCGGIERVIISEGVQNIGNEAFAGLGNVTEIVIPASVTNIGWYSFSRGYNNDYERITVAEGNTVYHSDGNCLIETESKILILGCKNSVIPADGSVTEIGDSAFSGCSELTSITIPESVTYIGERAFGGCSGLTEITIPGSVTAIGNYAFNGCKGLTEITIPGSVKEIGDWAFEWCTGLTAVTISDGVERIGYCVFYCCTAAANVFIPDSVTEIGADAFYEVRNIFYSDNMTAQGSPWGARSVNGFTEGNFVYTDSTKKELICCSPAVKGSLNVPAGIETIGDGAFSYCELITEIILPDSVNTIGNGAFRYCYSLEKINLPEGIETIPTGAFSSCRELKEITIPESVTEIGAKAFTGCKSLETVEIPSGVTIIGELAFDDCFGLKSVKMGDTIEKINLGAFNRCFSLESVTIPESVTEIGTGAFGGCMSLGSVVIPGNVKTIDSYAFAYCYSLSDVVISEGVENIGEAAFSDCFVKNLTLPRSVKTVGKQILNFNEPTYEYSPEWIAYMKAEIEQFRAELEQLTPEEREIRLYEVRHDLKYYEIIFNVFENNDPKNFTTDVWFGGSSADRQAVTIDQENDLLLNATWHYTLKNNSGVSVEFEDGAFTQDDINLVVEEVNDSSVTHAFTMHGVKEENIKHIYNIYIQNGNGEHVQPKGKKVTVRIPIPDGFNLNENYYIYHKKANVEKPERFLKKDIIVENGFFVIEVESFSEFAIIQGGEPEVMINGFVKSVDVDYKTTVNFSATAYDLPDGASIHWYINGKDEGKGEKYTAEKAKATYTVQVKVIGADGETVAESEKETVNVNTGFFAKLIAFFRNLFNLLPVITQE